MFLFRLKIHQLAVHLLTLSFGLKPVQVLDENFVAASVDGSPVGGAVTLKFSLLNELFIFQHQPCFFHNVVKPSYVPKRIEK